MESIAHILKKVNSSINNKFDLTDSFRLRDFKENAKKGFYKDLKSAAKDLTRLFRYQEEAEENFVEKYKDRTTGIMRFKNVDYEKTVRKLRRIHLFDKENSIGNKIIKYNAYNAFEAYEEQFYFDEIHFNSDNPKDLTYFTGFKYKILQEINHEVIDNYLKLISEGISGNDSIVNDYIIKWIANIIQNPGVKNEVALVISGNSGTGKTTFTDILCNLLSGYSKTIQGVKRLTGEYNSVIENKMLIVANELDIADSNFEREMNALKSIITDDQKDCRKIYEDFYTCENVCNFIFCSNYDNSITINNDDRRYCIIKSSDKFKGDFEFFKQLKELPNDFYDNLLSYFLKVDLKDFNPRDFPITEARENLIENNLSKTDFFILNNLELLNDGLQLKEIIRLYNSTADPLKHTKYYSYEINGNLEDFKTFLFEIKNKCSEKQATIDYKHVKIYKLNESEFERYNKIKINQLGETNELEELIGVY